MLEPSRKPGKIGALAASAWGHSAARRQL